MTEATKHARMHIYLNRNSNLILLLWSLFIIMDKQAFKVVWLLKEKGTGVVCNKQSLKGK